MSVSVRGKILIWTMSGGRCAYPDCDKHLVMSTLEGAKSLVGEVAHIVSEKADGPRGDYNLAAEGIGFDDDENLMLLCNIHHKLVDEHPADYPVHLLREYKSTLETNILAKLSPEEKQVAFDKRMVASNIEEFEKLIDIDNWRNKTESVVFDGCPWISKRYFESLSRVPEWILSRVWPEGTTYDELKDALNNFKAVLCDFLITFQKHSKDFGDMWKTEKFYKIDEWNTKLYNQLFYEWSFHVGVVEDLLAELTRAVNLVSAVVRKTLDRSYRYEKGLCLISTGLSMDLTIGTRRTEYKSGELYPGLKEFKKIRVTRDFHFSAGEHAEDKEFLKTQN